MRNIYSFILLFFVINTSFAQEVTATQKFPDTAIPGGDYLVEVTISKSGVTGFMKIFQGVPAGCTATAMESKGGSFTFADGGAKIIWITPPAEDQFTISYQVNIPKEVSGVKNINGKIAYLLNNERKVYDMETKTIKIGDEGVVAGKAETVLVTGSDRTIVTSSPVLTPKDPDMAPSRIIPDTPPKETTPAPTPVGVKEEPPKITPPPAPPAEPVKKAETPPTPAPVIVKKEETKPTPPETPVVTKKEEKKVAPANLPTGGNVPVTAIPSSAGKTFRVQIGAFSSKPTTLNGVPELSTVVLDNGITKCFSGNFATYEAAAKRKKELIDKGFQGAFVVSFENGKIVK